MATKTVETVSDKALAEMRAADDVLLEAAMECRQLSYSEQILIARANGVDTDTVQRWLSRAARVIRNQDIAGTRQAREALAESLVEAKQRVENEGAAIEEEIAHLQQRRDALHRDVESKQKRLDEANNAVAQLRANVPEFIAKEANERRKAIMASIGSDIAKVRARRDVLRHLLNEPEDPKVFSFFVEAWGRECPEAVIRKEESGWIRKGLNTEVVESKSEEFRAEIEQLEAELQPMESAFESEMAEVDELLNYYVK